MDGIIRLSVKQDRKKITKKKYQKISEDYYTGDLSFGDVQAKLNGTYAFLQQGDTREFRKYLSNRYRFTHDMDTMYQKKNSLPKS